MTAIKIPRPGSYPETICKTIYLHGQLTVKEGIAIHGILGSKPHDTKEVYQECVNRLYIKEIEGKFQLRPSIYDHIKKIVDAPKPVKLEVVKKRTNNSKGEMPVQKRDPRIREIYFKTVGGV